MTEKQRGALDGLIHYLKQIMNFRAIISTITASFLIYLCVMFSSFISNNTDNIETVKTNTSVIKKVETLVNIHDLRINEANFKIESLKIDHENTKQNVVNMQNDIREIKNLLIEIASGQRRLINK